MQLVAEYCVPLNRGEFACHPSTSYNSNGLAKCKRIVVNPGWASSRNNRVARNWVGASRRVTAIGATTVIEGHKPVEQLLVLQLLVSSEYSPVCSSSGVVRYEGS